MKLLHVTTPSAAKQALSEGLRYGATGGHNTGPTRRTNRYLDELCPPLLRSLGISRIKCLYFYLVMGGMVHDIVDGKRRSAGEWVQAQVPNVVLAAEVDMHAAYVSDLDAYDVVAQAVTSRQPPYVRDQLARHYWQTLVPLHDIATQYRLDTYGLVLTGRRHAPALPERLHRAEVLDTRSIAPESIGRYA